MTTEQLFTTTDDNRRLETTATFNADQPLTLSVTNASGSVSIHTDDQRPAGSALIQIRRTDDKPFDSEEYGVTIKSENNAISVHPDWQFAAGISGLARRFRDQLQHGFRAEDWNLSRLRLSPELDFHFDITLPANLAEGSQVKLRTASGDVTADDITAQVSVVTASGDVNAANLTGVVAIHTASADVRATNVNESLEVNTASGDVAIAGGDMWLAARSASGDVSIRAAHLRNSRITTVSGDISLDATLDNTTSYGMETVSGDISINAALPGSGTRTRLGFGTLSGSSNVDPAWQKTGRREWHAGEGESESTINVKTVSGDLSATAHLDPSVVARSLEMPVSDRFQDHQDSDPGATPDMNEFKQGMKEFKRGMRDMHDSLNEGVRGMHQGINEGFRGMHTSAQPPVRPADATGPMPPAPPTPARSPHDPASPIFTAGPSGQPYRQEPAESSAGSQHTEPVTPPTSFPADVADTTDEIVSDSAPTPATQHQDGTNNQISETPQATPEDGPARQNRIDVLEMLERGEISIDEAMAQLEAEKDSPAS